MPYLANSEHDTNSFSRPLTSLRALDENIEGIDADGDYAQALLQDKLALAHISTDKPIYKPDDVMFIEVHVVHPVTKAPARSFSEITEWSEGYYDSDGYWT